jgi:hypothetical protein
LKVFFFIAEENDVNLNSTVKVSDQDRKGREGYSSA